jgi:alkylhydroperoxidase family enzyme
MANFLKAIAALALGAAITTGTAMAQAPDTADLKQRDEQILGKPSRLHGPKEVTEEQRQMALPPPGYGRPGELPEHYLIMLKTPELLKAYSAIGTYFLVHGKMPVRDRELLVLRVGWLTRAPYEWGEHVAIGKKRAGLTSEEIARVQTGSIAPGWSEHDRALLKAVEELFADAMISDETWQILAKTMSEEQLIELPVLIGQYVGTAFVQNSWRIRLRESNPGMTAK